MLLKNGLTSNERIQRPRRTLRRGKKSNVDLTSHYSNRRTTPTRLTAHKAETKQVSDKDKANKENQTVTEDSETHD